MSEERAEPREERLLPPEHVHLYKAPGMDTVSFAELLMGSGIRRDLGEWMEGVNGQIASLQEQVNQLTSQLAELRQQATPQQEPEPPSPEPPPSRPMPPRRPHR